MEHNKKGKVAAFLSGIFVATAIGGYFFFGSKNAKNNRNAVEDWVKDAKADVVSRIKKIKKLSRDKYYEIVDDISDKYSEMKEIGIEKTDELREELKKKWKEIEKEAREEGGD